MLPVFELPRAEQGADVDAEVDFDEVRAQGEKLRQRALYPVPEEAPQLE